jgi:hypothetical protein
MHPPPHTHTPAHCPPPPAGGGLCTISDASQYLICPENSTDPYLPEVQFAIFSPSLTAGEVLSPDTTILIKSLATGKFCRLVKAPGCPTMQVKCDADHTQAGRFQFNDGAIGLTIGANGMKLIAPGTGGMKPVRLAPMGTPGNDCDVIFYPGARLGACLQHACAAAAEEACKQHAR